MHTLVQDVRVAVRQLGRTPGFAAIVVLTLALGIGANTAIFSVMNAVMLRSLPVHDAGRLVYLHYSNQPRLSSQTGYDDTSLPENAFEALRKEHQVFSDLMAFVPLSASKIGIRYGNDLQQAEADMVSGNFFSGLGISAAIGRTFTAEDESQHTQNAVLSYAYWKSRFHTDPEIIGQTLYIKGVPFTIVGVAAPGFSGFERRMTTEVWVPLQSRNDLKPWGNSIQDPETLYGTPTWFCLMTIGRLQPGVTQKQAISELDPIFQNTVYSALGAPGKEEPKTGLYLTSARGIEGYNNDYKEPLYVLMAMVALVLVIACINVAMLLVARNSSRQREFSVRIALGGTRARIFRQLLTESLLLVTAGAVLGWLFAIWSTHALASLAQMESSLTPDRAVLLFTFGISILSALFFGLAPLRSATNVPVGMVKSASLVSQQDRSKARTSKMVVSLQISLCLVLLVGAGLLIRTLGNLNRAKLGFQASGLLVFGVNLPLNITTTPAGIHFYDSILQRLRALPDVESATVMVNRIGAGWSNNTAVAVDGKNPLGSGKFAPIRWNIVGSSFLHVLGVTPILGRDFTDGDTASALKVAIVNQTFVDRYLPKENPIGHAIALEEYQDKYSEPFTIVGVVSADMRYTAVRENPRPLAYVPYTQLPETGDMNVEIRTHGNPMAALDEVRRVMHEVNPDLPLLQPTTQMEQLQQSYSDERLFSRLATFFGLLAALLVATGLYGTLAYRVSRRTAEIGVRMALGAQRIEVLWMILRESLIVAAIGIAIGLPLAFAGSRLMKSMLFGLSPADPLTFLVALVGVGAVALISALLPARSASSVEPMVALRHE
jgi:predicted permease